MAGRERPTEPEASDHARLTPPSDRRGVEVIADDGRRFLVSGSALVGRAPSADAADGVADLLLIAFDDPDKYVSKNHALLRVDRGVLWVIDRGSTNGTSLRGPLGTAEVPATAWKQGLPGEYVHVGDRWLQIGATIGPEFRVDAPQQGASPPAVPAESEFINVDDSFQALSDRTAQTPRPDLSSTPPAPAPAPAAEPGPRPTMPRPAPVSGFGGVDTTDRPTVGGHSFPLASEPDDDTGRSRTWLWWLLAAIVVAGGVFAALQVFGGDDETDPPPATATESAGVLAAIDADPELSSFAALVERTPLAAVLSGPNPVTVFAPTNAALDALPNAAQLATDDDLALQIVTAHLAPSLAVDPASLAGQQSISVGGRDQPLTATTIGTANFVGDGEQAGAGYLYRIDGVLWAGAATPMTAPGGAITTVAPGGATTVAAPTTIAPGATTAAPAAPAPAAATTVAPTAAPTVAPTTTVAG